MPVRLAMPSPGREELRQLAGTEPVSRFALAFSVCRLVSRDHSAGRLPLRVLLPRLTLRRLAFVDHEPGMVPAQAILG
jgi:hypothetical protein